ncbi:MAG: DUF1150 family protein [Pseudomonadota bacterium]
MTELRPAHEHPVTVSAETLAAMGEGEVAYVRTFQSEELMRLFPNAPELTPGHKFWALLSAGGHPIVLADTPQAVLKNAMEQNLLTVSVH